MGAKLGILIKGGDAFQAAREVTAVIFDKTGRAKQEKDGHPASTHTDFLLSHSESTETAALRPRVLVDKV